jgi:hypothetical protein
VARWLRAGQGVPAVKRPAAPVNGPLVQPSADELKNGWTAETLTAYHAERFKAQSGVILFDANFRKKPKPRVANGNYRPLRAFR